MNLHDTSSGAGQIDSEALERWLRQFQSSAQHHASATVDNLVTVNANGSMLLESVTIDLPAIDADLRRRLEAAIVSAANAAISQVALSLGRGLDEIGGGARAPNPDSAPSER
jgi:DNA-binding protein YbaB